MHAKTVRQMKRAGKNNTISNLCDQIDQKERDSNNRKLENVDCYVYNPSQKKHDILLGNHMLHYTSGR